MSDAVDLRDVTKDWFLFLSTCRRQTAAIPAEADWMREKLDGLLRQMESAASVDARLEKALEEAKYPLVYLADEVLLTCGWEGEAAWASDLYETRTFGTQHSGLDFFLRLDQALEGDRDDLIQVFFMCLCLGFKGKFIKQPEALHNLRRDLYRRLPTEQASVRFCPDAYEATDTRSFTKLPVVNAAKIVIPFVAALIFAWVFGTWRTAAQLEEIDIKTKNYLEADE
ncbi:MAG: DotU family type IV/VI secretion system protein [Planctomycetota bacterium]|jgi:type IV/VI secretion system ImpK/VasF family protein